MKKIIGILLIILLLPIEVKAANVIDNSINSTIWILMASFLVFFMQAGFAMLEAGFSQAKNAGNIVMKNIMDFSVGSLVYWVFGFAIMFGLSNQIVGQGPLFLQGDFAQLNLNVPLSAFWLFQTVFAATAATIVSGAMAGRTKFSGYLTYSIVITGFIYPVVGHWIWGGGWLSAMVDFSGATVVHSVGGWTALAGAKVLGPRLGKYNSDGSSNHLAGHNLLIAALGTFILWFGWFGFNTGNLVAQTSLKTDNIFKIADIAVVTNLSGAAGATTALITSWFKYGKADVKSTLNGALAGLVGVTAGCFVVNNFGAVIIGSLSGLVMVYASQFIDKVLKIDDPVGAISVHGVCGSLGTLLVGFFAVDRGYFYSGELELLFIQAKGVISVAIWSLTTAYILFKLIDLTIGLRVSKLEERSGLDKSEHGAEIYAGFTSLEYKNEFEKFSSELAVNFINLEFAELDKAIAQGLKKVTMFFEANSSHIYLFDEDRKLAIRNYEWTNEEDNLKFPQQLKVTNFPWLMGKINLAQNILLFDRDDLPAVAQNEAELFNARSINSLIITSIMKQNSVIGFFVIEGVNDHRLWETNLSTLLETIDQTFGDVLERKKIEEKIKESMDEQQLLLDNIKTQIWYIKDPCTYVAANEARADFLGVDKDDISYAEIDNLLSSEIAGSCKQDNQEVFKQKEIVKTQGWVRNAAGERRYHSITKIPKLNEQGEVEYVICSAEDITEQKKAEAKLNQYAEKLDEQIVKAQQLHEKFLPSKLPEIPEVTMADYYQPAERLGGDFYNIINLDDILMGYVVDITGHGLDGSLLNIFVRETINSFLLSDFDLKKKNHLSELMKFITRKYQQEEFSDDYFISIILFELDKETLELTYCNAGIHIPPLLISEDDFISFNPIKEPPISSVIEFDNYEFKQKSFQLKNNDSLLIATDGLVEEQIEGEYYGLERLKDNFLKYHSSSPQKIIEKITTDFQNFSGQDSGSDDITLLLLKVNNDA